VEHGAKGEREKGKGERGKGKGEREKGKGESLGFFMELMTKRITEGGWEKFLQLF
jgi:hypothetical protein